MTKRLVIGLSLAVIATALWGSNVFADPSSNPHGNYGAVTDKCAGCHRTHTGQGPYLLTAPSTYELCLTCHGSMAGGAQTNVVDGVYGGFLSGGTYGNKTATGSEGTVGDPLLGGGFSYYKVQGQTSFAATTSTHDPTGTQAGAWGYGDTTARGVTQPLSGTEKLDCVSCHDPHGSPNYRIIKATVNGVSVTVPQDEGGTKSYTEEHWATGTGTGISYFCAACHTSYHKTNAGQGSMLDLGSYTHRIDMPFNAAPYTTAVNPETVGTSGYKLPLANSATGGYNVVCTTCHLPHGSSAPMTAGGYADQGGLPGNTSTTDSALLRLQDRGVCEVCHQK